MSHVVTALVIYTAVVSIAALGVRLTRAWWRTQVGRHLTAMILALAVTFTAWALSILDVIPMPPAAWAVLLAHVAVVITWRLVLEVQAAATHKPIMGDANGKCHER